MAEEQKAPAAAPQNAPSSGKNTLILVAGAGVFAVILALGVYKFVLAPKLTAEPATPPEVPPEAVVFTFDQAHTTAIMPPGTTAPASLVMYKVSFLCSNAATAEIIKQHQSWFADMLRTLHSGKERAQLDDPMLSESIRKQALIKANEILKTLLGEKAEQNKVLKVFHDEFYVYDQ